MTIKSKVLEVEQGIITGVHNFEGFVAKEFTALDNEAKIYLPIAIKATNILKTIMASPVTNIAESVIGGLGIVNPAILAKVTATINNVLAVVASDLTYANDIANLPTGDAILKAALEKVKLSSNPAQDNFWRGVSNALIDAFTNGTLTASQRVYLEQFVFDHIGELNGTAPAA